MAALFALVAATAEAQSAAFCAATADCAAGSCVGGLCLPSCITESDCGPGLGCVAGGCLPAMNVSLAIDYGLAQASSEPGCFDDTDCSPSLLCTGGTCTSTNARSCLDFLRKPNNSLCPPFAGMTCSASGACTFGTCTTNDSCKSAYPIGGLQCIGGRCTSRCTTNSECCSGSIKCSSRPQDTCFTPVGGTGVCTVGPPVAARLISYRIANPDPTQVATNIFFVAEGFTVIGNAEMGNFDLRAMRHLQWLLTHADSMNALLTQRHNIFILEIPDRATGMGSATAFGRFADSLDAVLDFPGSDAQGLFTMQNALGAFAAAGGLSVDIRALNAKGVFLFNQASDHESRATGGSRIVVQMNPGNVPEVALPSSASGDRRFAVNNDYFVMQHEFGHFLTEARNRDEYDSDSPNKPAGVTPDVSGFSLNTVPRTVVTSPACSVCDGSDDGTFSAAAAPWSALINSGTFPTTAADFSIVGLYAGAEGFFKTEAMRSQKDCVMRQDGRQDFCPACVKGFLTTVIPSSTSQAFRFLDPVASVLEPASGGSGPNEALAVSSLQHRTLLTRFSTAGTVLTDIDGRLLAREGTSNVALSLGGAPLPRSIVIDEPGMRAFTEVINAATPSLSGLIAYDMTSKSLIANPAPLLPTISIPFLIGLPIVDPVANAVFAYRERLDSSGNPVGEVATVDLAASVLSAAFTAPTTRAGGLPRLVRRAAIAPAAKLIFWPVSSVFPPRAACDSSGCEIWVFDSTSQKFLDGSVLRVSSVGLSSRGVLASTVAVAGANAAFPGELYLVATEDSVVVWRTADVRSGNSTPLASWSHNFKGTFQVSAVAYSAPTDQVVLGNGDGLLALFDIHGQRISTPTLALRKAGMGVREILTISDGIAYVSLAGLLPASRDGVVAALNLTSTTNPVVLSELPVAAIGIGGTTLALDTSFGILYTNAVVDTGDRIGSLHPYRIPILRAAGP